MINACLKWNHDSNRRVYQNDKFIIILTKTKDFYGYILRKKTNRKNFKFMDNLGKFHNLSKAKNLLKNT